MNLSETNGDGSVYKKRWGAWICGYVGTVPAGTPVLSQHVGTDPRCSLHAGTVLAIVHVQGIVICI